MKREDRAAGKLPAETTNTTATTKHESIKTGVADNQQDKGAAVAKSTDDSNTTTTLPPTSTVRDDHPTQSDEKQEHTVAHNSDGEQQPDKPSDHMEHKSTTGDDAISFEPGPDQPVPSSGGGSGWRALALFNHGELVDEDEEEQQRRRAEFAAQRQRHVLADSLQAHYDAIFAEVFAGAEFDDDDDEQQEQPQPQPHQDNNNEENTTAVYPNATRPERHHLAVAMDLFMQMMEADDEELDESESDSE